MEESDPKTPAKSSLKPVMLGPDSPNLRIRNLNQPVLRHFWDNPVARMRLGIEPANQKRRRRAVLTFLFPSLLYIALAVSLVLGEEILNWKWNGQSHWRRGEFDEILTMISASIVVPIVPWTALIMVWSATRSSIRPESNSWIEELKLTGLGAPQILTGSFARELIGLMLLGLLQLILIVSMIPLTYLVLQSRTLFGMPLWLTLSWSAAVAVGGLGAYLFSTLIRASINSSMGRLVLSFLFGLAQSPTPWMILLWIPGILQLERGQAISIEFASWPFRLAFFIWFWRRQCRRIDEGGFE